MLAYEEHGINMGAGPILLDNEESYASKLSSKYLKFGNQSLPQLCRRFGRQM